MSIIPLGVKDERDWQTRCLGTYICSSINIKYLPISALSEYKYGRVLYRLVRDIVLANPYLGPVYLLKVDARNRFYRITLQPEDDPNPGLVSPSLDNGKDMVATPLTIPMR